MSDSSFFPNQPGWQHNVFCLPNSNHNCPQFDKPQKRTVLLLNVNKKKKKEQKKKKKKPLHE